MQYLNLGCGSRYHSDWVNVDIDPIAPGVIAHDLSQRLPFSDASFDVVYHSAVLEHMRRADALPFVRECHRVLKPEGILRVAVPDLEQICHLYLKKLEASLANDVTSAHDYDWIMLEMYDQSVRERSGGEMLAYLSQFSLPNESFVRERIGEEGRKLIGDLRYQSHSPLNKLSLLQRAQQAGLKGAHRRLRSLASSAHRQLLSLLLGPDAWRALEIGRFRLAGEVHHWMYDRYSLARLLLRAGFHDLVQQSATTSRIPQWPGFNLDTLPDGTVIKPDSLFMEAVKPT